MAKSSLEKALEKHQKEIERQFKKKIYAEKKLANKQRQDSERQAKINARRERASSIVGGQPTVGDIRILDNDFTGSKNAIIDVNAIAGNYIEGNNFSDTTILNLLNGKRSSLPSQTKHLKLEGASIVVQSPEEQEEIQNYYLSSTHVRWLDEAVGQVWIYRIGCHSVLERLVLEPFAVCFDVDVVGQLFPFVLRQK